MESIASMHKKWGELGVGYRNSWLGLLWPPEMDVVPLPQLTGCSVTEVFSFPHYFLCSFKINPHSPRWSKLISIFSHMKQCKKYIEQWDEKKKKENSWWNWKKIRFFSVGKGGRSVLLVGNDLEESCKISAICISFILKFFFHSQMSMFSYISRRHFFLSKAQTLFIMLSSQERTKTDKVSLTWNKNDLFRFFHLWTKSHIIKKNNYVAV